MMAVCQVLPIIGITIDSSRLRKCSPSPLWLPGIFFSPPAPSWVQGFGGGGWGERNWVCRPEMMSAGLMMAVIEVCCCCVGVHACVCVSVSRIEKKPLHRNVSQSDDHQTVGTIVYKTGLVTLDESRINCVVWGEPSSGTSSIESGKSKEKTMREREKQWQSPGEREREKIV